MRRLLVSVLALAAPAVVQAQNEPKAAVPDDPVAAHGQLVRDLEAAVTAWREKARAAAAEPPADGKPIAAISMVPPTAPFVKRAEELAKAFAGKDDAVRFLAFVCQNASQERDAVLRAVRTLRTDHAKSAAIDGALDHLRSAFWLGARADAMALLDSVIDGNPAADVKAHALLVRGNFRLQAAQTAGQREAAEQDLRAAASTTDNAALQKRAKDALFEIEHLQIGCTAPDIVAKDTDGAAMKLSDYRGKVILLDFWGFW